jgi:hypothetical protein
MADIAPTRIGTSYPIDICDGVALFPALGALQVGESFSHGDPVYILKPVKKRILLWRFAGKVRYEFITGICGPSYAATVVLAGKVDDTEVSLTVSQDEAAAGVFIGMTVLFPISFAVESGSPRWSLKHGWSVKWKKAFSISPTPKIDILDLLIKLIRKLMKEKKKSSDIKDGKKLEGDPKENKEKKDKKKPKVSVKSWAIFDSIKDQYGKRAPGELTPEPTLTIVVNLVPLFPDLEAIDKGLKALWGGLSLGPKFHFIVPVHIQFKRIAIDGTPVEGITFDGKSITGSLPAPVDGAGELHAEVDHETGLTFGISFYLSVSICKCFSFDPETGMLRLDDLFGWEIKTDAYCTGFRNKIGDLESPKPPNGPIVECTKPQVTVVLDP